MTLSFTGHHMAPQPTQSTTGCSLLSNPGPRPACRFGQIHATGPRVYRSERRWYRATWTSRRRTRCALDKAIYGLVQSGLMWEEEHHATLKATGWIQCEAEPCLFKRAFDDVNHWRNEIA
mmetsp:Transcript_30538/g.45981  ORF Transcript_30538/g.45981 Transcript_30538/m.45981 type:complete len:120 (-) Transcript_30538:215-574(-)